MLFIDLFVHTRNVLFLAQEWRAS